MPQMRKRSEERIRRNIEPPTEKVSAFGAVEQPTLDFEDPHPTVVRFWNSLGESAQSKYYEPSDWEYARICLHMLDKHIRRSNPSAQMMAVIQSMMNDLLVSEGSRRKVRLEVEREAIKMADVINIASVFEQRARSAA